MDLEAVVLSWLAPEITDDDVYRDKIMFKDGGHDNSSATEANDKLFRQKEELEKYKEEAQANESYMLQYKEIASSNEAALKQMESAYQDYKTESENAKRSLEDEIAKLRNNLSEMEKSYIMKCEETASAIEAKEKDITTLMNDIAVLRNEVTQKVTRIENLEIELASSKSALDEQCKRWRTAQDNYERQVILQSETIQELTNTSKQLSSLQQEIAILRQTADSQKAENDALRTFGEQEKIELVKEKDEALRKYNELNDQNRILHNRLEALHIRLAEQEQGIAGISSQRTDSHGEDDLHGVVSYLRRSKEIAETAISLLKQEKSRLQIELESALKSSKEAQDLLCSQADSARTSMFKDEEFKSLQLQKFREEVHKAKQADDEICRKELEMQKTEIANLNQRISELVENSRGVDLKTYETMKAELQNVKGDTASTEITANSGTREPVEILASPIQSLSNWSSEETIPQTKSWLLNNMERPGAQAPRPGGVGGDTRGAGDTGGAGGGFGTGALAPNVAGA